MPKLETPMGYANRYDACDCDHTRANKWIDSCPILSGARSRVLSYGYDSAGRAEDLPAHSPRYLRTVLCRGA